MKKLLLAISAVALVAMPAFASVQNIKVSGSIDNSFVYRKNFDFGNAVGEDVVQKVFISQTTLGVAADLSDNISANVGLINERVWNNDNTDNSAALDTSQVSLYLAYVTLKEMLYSPLTVVVGRQTFAYGNSFIIDATGTNNSAPSDSGLSGVAEDLTKQTAMDAVRAILDYNPLKLEFLFSKLNSNTTSGTNNNETNRDDVDLLGANATWEVGDAMKTQVEGYFFAKIDHSLKAPAAASNAVHKNDTVYVPGLRASTNPIEGLNVQGELAWQKGTKVIGNQAADVQERDALGAQFIANYQVPVLKEYKPVAQYVYTYVSGDHSPNSSGVNQSSATQRSSEKWTAWDPMFENQGGGTIYNAIFNLSNAHIQTASLQANPMDDVTLKGTWTGLWLDRKTECGSNLLGCNVSFNNVGAITTNSYNIQDNKKFLGNEFDFQAVYNYTEDFQIGANLGWFFPGDVFHGTNRDSAKQAIVHALVNF